MNDFHEIYNHCYMLNGKEIKECKSFSDFEIAFKFENRKIKHTRISEKLISTVFLVLDHNVCNKGDPVLFETMIFPDQEIYNRYSTFEEAVKGHDHIVELIRISTMNNEIKDYNTIVRVINRIETDNEFKISFKKLQKLIMIGIECFWEYHPDPTVYIINKLNELKDKYNL